MVVIIKRMMVLRLHFDRHGHLNRLHDRLRVHVGVMLHRDMDANPVMGYWAGLMVNYGALPWCRTLSKLIEGSTVACPLNCLLGAIWNWARGCQRCDQYQDNCTAQKHLKLIQQEREGGLVILFRGQASTRWALNRCLSSLTSRALSLTILSSLLFKNISQN